MKRSGKEGRGADLSSARVRFALEAVFLVLVALGAALLELSPIAILGLMGFAWLLVALIERASSGEPLEETEPEEEVAVPETETAPVAIKPRHVYRWLFRRRGQKTPEPAVAPTATLEERPSPSHVRRIDAAPPPAELTPAAEATAPVDAGAPKPPPGAAVTTRPLELRGLEKEEAEPEPVRAPAAARPEPPVERPAAPQPPASPPSLPPQFRPPQSPPREWNLWDLERRARERAGDAPRDEEWSALFMHLREFATAEGLLPREFDGLVRESFAQLIDAA